VRFSTNAVKPSVTFRPSVGLARRRIDDEWQIAQYFCNGV